MKQHWILSVPLVFHISNYVNPATHQGTGTALAIINITYLGGMAYSEGTDFGRREQKVSRVGAAATSSVRSFQSLIGWGKRRNSCSQYNTWQVVTGYNREWEWWALVILG